MRAAYRIGSKKQGGFAELASVESVFGIAVRAYGEHDVQAGIFPTAQTDDRLQFFDTLPGVQRDFLKQPARLLVAVAHNQARFLQPVGPVCS